MVDAVIGQLTLIADLNSIEHVTAACLLFLPARVAHLTRLVQQMQAVTLPNICLLFKGRGRKAMSV